MKARDLFTTIRTEGGLLPADLLQRLVNRDKDLPGLDDGSYHIVAGERLNERISQSWKRLLGAWNAFRAAADALPERDAGTTLTRERWLLILLQELEYGRLPASRAIDIDGKSYAISHFWHHSPIHLVSYRLDLDRRTAGAAGAARTSPHSLVQEFLNRSDDYLWGFVSNGLRLRILRDNISLTRQAFIEFDLEGMMEGEVYADFVLLWLLCHQSRVEAEKPEECWLERWARAAQKQGTRALDRLRNSVEQAIKALGRGFLAHPANAALRGNLRSGALVKQDYYRQLLRLVYRLLFLFVAEDRDLLYDPTTSSEARERYTRYYATGRFRHLAARHRGTKHIDLYQGLRIVMEKLGCDDGCPSLALPALGGFLWSETAIHDLAQCEISNRDILEAVRALAFTLDSKTLRAVDYKNLGSEELGSIYESLLELHPDLNIDAASFDLTTAGGHERKTTGSYYTPSSLIQYLLDSALDPVLEEAARQPNAEEAILALKVCDPACGSGHFLIAAAHRMARRLAAIRTGDEEPAPEATRTALRDVISHCIYGVDVNPMAVELCKVSLWMESLEPGKPLTFLDHHIQCGNSLLGTTPALLAQGIPDEAFKPIEGDDKAVAAALRKRNRVEREGQMTFDAIAESAVPYSSLTDRVASLDAIDDSSIVGVHEKEERYNRLAESADYRKARLVADAWCAAFMWKKTKDALEPVTHDVFFRLLSEPEKVPAVIRIEILWLAKQYHFFHWHLAFPDVFRIPSEDETPGNEQTGWTGGFDVVLGNPPWIRQEMLKPVKNLLSVFDSFRSTADLSIFFIERSLNIVRFSGRIGLLTPNKWLGANYGALLRSVLIAKSRIHFIVDFGHSRTLFPDADTFPAAVVFEPVAKVPDPQTELRFIRAYDSDRQNHTLTDLLCNHYVSVPHSNLKSEQWYLEDNQITDFLNRLMQKGVPLLKVLKAPILSGLKTGFNKAFYIDSPLRDRLINEHPEYASLLKKFLRGRDIHRWYAKWEDQWHIVIPSSQNFRWPWSEASSAKDAEAIFERNYPSVFHHLKKFEDKLSRRTDKGQFWWELRACDYYEKFETKKIVLADITWKSEFALDTVPTYLNNTCYIIPSDDYIFFQF